MPRYRVSYDVTTYVEEYVGESDEGDSLYEDYMDEYSEDQVVEADSEEEAREIVKDSLWSYDGVYIWSIERVDD